MQREAIRTDGDPACDNPPALAVYQDFGFRTLLEIQVPCRMHVVASEGRYHNEVGAILEIEDRRRSRPPRFAALRSEHHEGRSPERSV